LFGAVTIAILIFADRFEIRHSNVYQTSPLQLFLQFFAPLIALAVIGPLYIWFLSRFFELKAHEL